jgi:glycerophosphoryl diester phosphodiesterase
MMNAPAWLTARPIAHRGLHDCGNGPLIENSSAAARAAIARDFAIECDVQLSKDGEAVVFHDFTLERLTAHTGRVDGFTAKELGSMRLRGGDALATLPEFLSLIDSATPLVCEIKSRFDGDMRLAERVAAYAAAYQGPICIESFDPQVMAHLRANQSHLQIEQIPLGMVAMANYDHENCEWSHLDADAKRALAQFLHFEQTRPDFLSYGLRGLPNAVPHLCRVGIGMPVTIWTVRTEAERALALRHADQIVFEGEVFRPKQAA